MSKYLTGVPFLLLGGLLIGLGARNEVSLLFGVPMIVAGFRLSQIGAEHLEHNGGGANG